MRKLFLIILAGLFLQGCATVTMTKEGDKVTWESKTLWKDIDTVEAESKNGEFDFTLGSSGSALTAQQLACLVNPAACGQ